MTSETTYPYLTVHTTNGTLRLRDASVVSTEDTGGYLSVKTPDGWYGWQEGEWKAYFGSDTPNLITSI